MIARMHTMSKLPKELRGSITLRPEDHVLLISPDSTELYGKSQINLKSRGFRKKYQAVIFFSKNVFQLMNLISHKYPGDSEEKTAELHYNVMVTQTSSYLLREGLISNHPGMNEIDTIALCNVIESKLNPRRDDLFGPLNLDNMRNPQIKEESIGRLNIFLQKTLAEYGMELVDKPEIRWSETSKEMLDSFKSARRDEIEANEELILLEQETSLSETQIQAQTIAQKRLKRSRRQLVKKEREFLEAQLQDNHQMKMHNLELEKEKLLIKKEHEIELLRKTMDNEISKLELEKKMNERFGDEERRILIEQKRAQTLQQQKIDEMEIYYQQQQLENELSASRAKNIESERALSEFERDEKLKNSETEAELSRIEQQTKMDTLNQLIHMKDQIKAKRSVERKSQNEILSPCGTFRLDSGEWVPVEAGNEVAKSSPDISSHKGTTQTISDNIIGGDLNIEIGKTTKRSLDSKQNISDNVISGNLNAKIDSDEN